MIAHSVDEVADVTRRYTAHYDEVLTRRDLAPEEWLHATLETMSTSIVAGLAAPRRALVEARRLAEREELQGPTAPAAGPQLPRQTGDLEWRRQRGELGEGDEAP